MVTGYTKDGKEYKNPKDVKVPLEICEELQRIIDSSDIKGVDVNEQKSTESV